MAGDGPGEPTRTEENLFRCKVVLNTFQSNVPSKRKSVPGENLGEAKLHGQWQLLINSYAASLCIARICPWGLSYSLAAGVT